MKTYYTKVIMKKADGSETEYICPVEKDGYYVDTRQLPNFLQDDELITKRDGMGRFLPFHEI